MQLAWVWTVLDLKLSLLGRLQLPSKIQDGSTEYIVKSEESPRSVIFEEITAAKHKQEIIGKPKTEWKDLKRKVFQTVAIRFKPKHQST